MRRHHYHSPLKRAFYSFALILSMLAVGTIGFHRFEHVPYSDAFYMTSMIATAQGLAEVPATLAGKLFACVMAFVSLGTVVAAAGFLFGPFLGQLWRVGHERWEKEEKG